MNWSCDECRDGSVHHSQQMIPYTEAISLHVELVQCDNCDFVALSFIRAVERVEWRFR